MYFNIVATDNYFIFVGPAGNFAVLTGLYLATELTKRPATPATRASSSAYVGVHARQRGSPRAQAL